MMIRAAILLVCLSALPANAKVTSYDHNGITQQAAPALPAHARVGRQARSHRAVGVRRAARHHHAGDPAEVVGGRPPGCPPRFCGCVASIKVFGRIRPELNLAANWLRKFPRTRPAPMMAAARWGHVMVLLEHVGGDKWKVYDGNSGGGRTRIHVRSIKGFAVVNPHVQMAHLAW